MPVSADLNKLLDKKYENTDLKKLPGAPVAAIAGVTDADAEMLNKSLGIKTISDMAHHRCVRAARAICELVDESK